MKNSEVEKRKNELLKPYWTEDLHHSLEKLPPKDAKKIVESMDDSEIYIKVNLRKHQEDYIADYIEYLWDISEDAYWKHIKISLDVEIGLLWSDNMSHFERMCNYEIPHDVLIKIIDFAIDDKSQSKQDFDAIGCVIKAQVERFARKAEIDEYISTFKEKKKANAKLAISSMIECRCHYQFY